MNRGVLLLIACATLWSLNGAIIKELQLHHGQTGLSIAIWRNVFAGLALLPFALRGLRRLPRTGWWLTAIVSFAAMGALFVSATTQTEASNAIILQYTAPCWIFLLSPWLLREFPPRHDWFILLFAMIGVGVIFFFQYTAANLGLLLAVASGAAFALVMLSFRRLRGANGMTTTCIVTLAAGAVLAPVPLLAGLLPGHVAASVVAPLPQHASTWLVLILMGVVQHALPYGLLSRALRHTTAATASLVTLFEPLLNTTWTYLWIGERPRASTAIGGGIILAALLFKNALDRRLAPRSSAPS